MSRGARGLLILAALELAAFGIFLPRLGFYHDDWVLLELARRGRGFGGSLAELAGGGFAVRPVEVLWFACLYAVGGLRPWVYQLALLAVELAAGWLFFRLAARLIGRPGLALAASALAMAYPNHAATHHWFAASPQTLALLLLFASLGKHLDWIERGRPADLGSSLALYGGSVLCYESTAFLPLLLAGGLFSRRSRAGNAGKAALETVKNLLPYAAPLAAALLWQRLCAPLLFHTDNPKKVSPAAGHALRVFGAGFECLTNRVLHAASLALPQCLKEAPWTAIVLWAATAIALAALLSRDAERDGSEDGGLSTALAMGAAGFFGAYAPYALSGDYTPQFFGVMSRTNAGGAWAGGLFLAAAIDGAGRRSPARRGAILAALLGVFLWTDWMQSYRWSQSWTEQQRVLGFLREHAAALPSQAAVSLQGADRELDHAVVFEAPWAFDAALKVATGREDLAGELVLRPGSYVYDYPAGRLQAPRRPLKPQLTPRRGTDSGSPSADRSFP